MTKCLWLPVPHFHSRHVSVRGASLWTYGMTQESSYRGESPTCSSSGIQW